MKTHMNMTKTTYLPGILLAFLCTLLLTGCNNEESNPLRFDLSADADNTVNVYFPQSSEDGNAGAITILGGDGNYTAQCDNPAVLKIDMKFSNAFVLYPQDWGETHVTVTDGTGTSIVLKVTIIQSKLTLTIGHMDVLIEGGETLTEEQRNALSEEALATIPVKEAGGGYKLAFDNPEDPNSGTLCLYPTVMNEEKDMVKGNFEVNPDRNEENPWFYTFVLEGMPHKLAIVPYTDETSKTRKEQFSVISLVEDVTGHLAEQYPNVQVFTQQVIWRPLN